MKQPDFEIEALLIPSEAKEPLQGKEIVPKLKEKMSGRFSKADLEITKGNNPRWEKISRSLFTSVLNGMV